MKRTSRRFFRRFIVLALGLLIVCTVALRAGASVICVSGCTVVAPPPLPGVHPGDYQPPTNLTPVVFKEFPGIGVIPDLVGAGGRKVDHDGSVVQAYPVESGNIPNVPPLVPATIPAGTLYESYLFHFDPADCPVGGCPVGDPSREYDSLLQ